MRRVLTVALCGGLAWAGTGLADEPIPADPTGKPNQMVTECMEKQDPAMNKEDALQACKDKMKQSVKVDKPKKPRAKPSDAPPGK